MEWYDDFIIKVMKKTNEDRRKKHMDIKEFLKPIMAKVERVSVHNKQLKSSWKEDAMVFTNVKPIDTHSVDVTV